MVRICQRELNRKTHVRQAGLGDLTTVRILHDRVDDALRMDDDIDPFIRYREKLVGLDDLQPFVHHRRRVDGDLRPIDQVGWTERLGYRGSPDLSSGVCRNGPPDAVRISRSICRVTAVETLPDRAVLAIDRMDRRSVIGRPAAVSVRRHRRAFPCWPDAIVFPSLIASIVASMAEWPELATTTISTSGCVAAAINPAEPDRSRVPVRQRIPADSLSRANDELRFVASLVR